MSTRAERELQRHANRALDEDQRAELDAYANGWRDFAPGWCARYEAAQPHNAAVRRPAHASADPVWPFVLLAVLIVLAVLTAWYG